MRTRHLPALPTAAALAVPSATTVVDVEVNRDPTGDVCYVDEDGQAVIYDEPVAALAKGLRTVVANETLVATDSCGFRCSAALYGKHLE